MHDMIENQGPMVRFRVLVVNDDYEPSVWEKVECRGEGKRAKAVGLRE